MRPDPAIFVPISVSKMPLCAGAIAVYRQNFEDLAMRGCACAFGPRFTKIEIDLNTRKLLKFWLVVGCVGILAMLSLI